MICNHGSPCFIPLAPCPPCSIYNLSDCKTRGTSVLVFLFLDHLSPNARDNPRRCRKSEHLLSGAYAVMLSAVCFSHFSSQSSFINAVKIVEIVDGSIMVHLRRS